MSTPQQMLAAFKPIVAGITLSFVGSQPGLNGSSFDISGTGRAAGDICLLWQSAVNFTGNPSNNTPSPTFTRIGSTVLINGSGYNQRINVWFRILDGTETAISNLMSEDVDDIMAQVFRKSGGTWQTPASVVLNGADGSPADATTLAGAGTPPLIVSGCSVVKAANSGNHLTSSPAADAIQFDGNALATSYNIYNSSPSNVTIGSDEVALEQGFKGAFYVRAA